MFTYAKTADWYGATLSVALPKSLREAHSEPDQIFD